MRFRRLTWQQSMGCLSAGTFRKGWVEVEVQVGRNQGLSWGSGRGDSNLTSFVSHMLPLPLQSQTHSLFAPFCTSSMALVTHFVTLTSLCPWLVLGLHLVLCVFVSLACRCCRVSGADWMEMSKSGEERGLPETLQPESTGRGGPCRGTSSSSRKYGSRA